MNTARRQPIRLLPSPRNLPGSADRVGNSCGTLQQQLATGQLFEFHTDGTPERSPARGWWTYCVAPDLPNLPIPPCTIEPWLVTRSFTASASFLKDRWPDSRTE